jgi:DNA polymerase I-like protein with 3'-5' exonuclease and polymerase domains
MESCTHPKLKEVQEVRAINRVRSVYLEENLITNVIRGRIHPQYIQMASDDGGTRTMRLACRNPNAQQFPKRSTLFDAKSLRKVLIPEDGMDWAKFDYWSQEPVIQCHYALKLGLPGAQEVRTQFERRRQALHLHRASHQRRLQLRPVQGSRPRP